MPKNTKMSKGAQAKNDDNDEDFDKMLAEVAAEDPQILADNSTQGAAVINSASISSDGRSGRSSSSSSNIGSQASPTPEATISEETNMIIDACRRGDTAQLRRWGRQGVCVRSVEPLQQSAANAASVEVLRCLVQDLGADVNGANQDGATPLYIAAERGHLAVVRCLVKELGADVNQAANDGATPLYFAAAKGYLAVALLLVEELGADVNQGTRDGATPLFIAAQEGHLARVRCLVKKLGADVNRTRHNGITPLMVAVSAKQDDVVAFLLKYGANPQLSSPKYGTAADVSKSLGASVEQTEYLEARTHCAMPGCSGAGAKKCAGCLKVYYCKRECQLMHWAA
jgi:hypothetical protein